jgi:broad specificity phosphatase PhoE
MIVLVRHGQSTLNASGCLAGRIDAPLTSIGEAQAHAAARAVMAMGPIARVVASPLQRAQATAAAFGMPVESDGRWIELDYGEYDGAPIGSVPESVWSTWRADASWAPPGGESIAAVGHRVRAACADLADAPGAVVVVSHVSPIKAAVAWALGVDDQASWRMYLAPGSICIIGLAGPTPSLRAYNITTHLAG